MIPTKHIIRKPVRIKRKPSVPQVQSSLKEADTPPPQPQETTLPPTIETSDLPSETNTNATAQDSIELPSLSAPEKEKSASQTRSISYDSLLQYTEDNSIHDESLLAEMARLEQELTMDQSQVDSSSLMDSRDDDDLMLEMEEFM